MALIERFPRAPIPDGVLRRIAGAFLPLDGGTLRDIGARREYQDYASSAAVTAGSDRRLHRIAEATRWPSRHQAGPAGLFAGQNLSMAERIGQDPTDISRHINEIQHTYTKALFAEQAGS